MTLTRETRDAIGRTVASLRTLFEREFGQQARGRYGLHLEEHTTGEADLDLPPQLRRHVEPESALSLSHGQRWQRRELVGALEYLVGEGATGAQAVERLVREASFTAVNRLLAIRVAEAVGVLPEVVGQGRKSAAYREIVGDLFPALATAEDEGFWTYLEVCGDELAVSVPLLFDRRSPVTAFLPSRSCIDDAVAYINDSEVAEAWREPEALGWAYQFFNTEAERGEMRAASVAPQDSHELAVRNQFFTPRYVVDWLVQNTLGRRLREAGYQIDLPLFEGEASPDGGKLALEDVRVLDPAVGSGHFLLGCYDLLETAWQSRGVEPGDAAERILPCLSGVDIDPRACQVAQAVLLLRARRAAPRAVLKPPAIVTARAMPRRHENADVLTTDRPDVLALADELIDALEDAPILGTLLKVDRRLEISLDATWTQPRLGSASVNDIHQLENEILEELRRLAGAADATPISRMFAADAIDAVRFLEILRNRYDAVLMNPPFGDTVPRVRDYLRSAYGNAAGDLYATFVARGIDLLRAGGYVGAITSRGGFFVTSLSGWRSDLVLPRLLALLDLGVGVMHKAMVEAAAYVLSNVPHKQSATFRRLLDEKDKDRAVYELDSHVPYVRSPGDFKAITGAPAAYWLSPRMLELFETCEPLGGEVDIRQGLSTTDDFRFVRLWWEAPANQVGSGLRWVPFVKGGDYSPYYADLHLVVDWENDGQRIRELARSKGDSESRIIRSRSHYFRPGLTWTRRSQKGFSVRPVPPGAIFADKGPMVFVSNDDTRALEKLMAYLNSSLVASLLEATVAFGSYEVGAVQRLPAVDLNDESGRLAGIMAMTRRRRASRDETNRLFITPWAAAGLPGGAREGADLSREVDVAVLRSAGESDQVAPVSAMYPTRWFVAERESPGAPSAADELSYLVGAALGRWDVRYVTGELSVQRVPEPFEPLSPTSPGMIVGEDGLPALAVPAGYPVKVPVYGLLSDDPGHAEDIVAAIERVNAVVRGAGRAYSDVRLRSEVSDLRGYLRSRFFAAHIRRYSASRRVAPIYWHLAVPSLEWGLWLYAPKLNREVLFAIAQAAQAKHQRLISLARQLRQSLSTADRSVRERLESTEALAGEVEEFKNHAARIAQSGWVPDLNDGAVLCAAPMEPLFRDRSWLKVVSQHRAKLEKGAYPWATVQRTYFRSH